MLVFIALALVMSFDTLFSLCYIELEDNLC